MAKEKKKAFFITIEGPEGAGKSSCAAILTRHLEAHGYPVICTREPGGTPLAEKLREVVKSKPDQNETIHPETELLLMEAARAQHVREKIAPALASGTSVICDRFSDSTCAYQGGGRDMDMGTINFLNDFATGGCVPDFTLLLDLPPETGFERVARRRSADADNDRFEAEKLDFHRRVREAFLALAKGSPERIRVIDASKTLDNVIEQVEKVAHELIF
ncbi:MAG: dTMP kinase [Lentisphaeria bacterium]|nr:dTMP kinase [Lentisphaeria bacterium]